MNFLSAIRLNFETYWIFFLCLKCIKLILKAMKIDKYNSYKYLKKKMLFSKLFFSFDFFNFYQLCSSLWKKYVILRSFSIEFGSFQNLIVAILLSPFIFYCRIYGFYGKYYIEYYKCVYALCCGNVRWIANNIDFIYIVMFNQNEQKQRKIN